MRILHLALVGFVALTAACSDMSAFTSQGWKYERVEDKLRGVTDVTAVLRSNEQFEGDGGVSYRMLLTIERKHGEPDIGWFPGNIFCDPSNPILMRLDKEPIETVPCRLFPQSNGHIARLDENAVRRIERASSMAVEFPSSLKPRQATFNVQRLVL